GPGNAVGLGDVAGPDGGGQAIDGGVAFGDGVVGILETDRGQDRAEDLLFRDTVIDFDVVEDGRLDEVAFAGADVGALAAGDEFGAVALAGFDIGEDRLHLFFGNECAEAGCGVERISGHHLVGTRARLGNLPDGQPQREVPRCDGADDADRLAERVGEGVVGDGNGLAGDFAAPAGEVVEALRRGRRIDVLRFENRLAVVDGLDVADV